MKLSQLNISSILFSLTLAAAGLRAEQTADAPSTPPAAPKAVAPAAPATHPMPPQGMLTPEEAKLLGQARMQLQKDPEIVDLSNQIKALMDKRAKLTEEKLQKINPEAAALLQKLKERQEKMMAERRAQMEAMQAKMKAQQEAVKPTAPAAPATTTTTAPTS